MGGIERYMGGMEFELGLPWALWFLPLPILILLLPPLKYRAEALFSPVFRNVLAVKKTEPTRGVHVARRNGVQIILMCFVWSLLLLSLASPRLIGEPEKKVKTARNMLLTVDLSLSMESRDWISSEGQQASRWEAVKEVMGEFIDEREGDRLGLVLFASQAYLQAHFTSDLEVVRSLLEQTEIGMAGARTVIGNAIGKGLELFEADSIDKKVMILVTDGADSGSELPPLQAARLAALDSIVIYTIGIGSTRSGAYELDETTLEGIAEATGGQYFRASDREQLQEIYSLMDELEPIEFEDDDYIPRRLLFYYPMLLAFGLALGYHMLAGLVSVFRPLITKNKNKA